MSQEFLAARGVKVARRQDAREAAEADEALRIARSARRVIATKGRGIVRLDVPTASDEALLAAILGPMKRLRAPAIRVGDVLLVGFTDELYREFLGE